MELISRSNIRLELHKLVTDLHDALERLNDGRVVQLVRKLDEATRRATNLRDKVDS